jgi:UDP-N-acetylmuramyl pentapeptide phosphotransferase/UDP-N-acetylglucosamine-1-phosphate transferase
MSNTSSPVPRGKQNHKHLQPVFSVISIIVAVLFVAAFLLNKPRVHYPEVGMQVGDAVRVVLLQQPHNQASQCEAAVRRLVEVMKNVCPECTMTQQRCIQKLSPRQKLFLDGAPVDVSVIRLPNGVITFEATDPVIAQQTCTASEQQAGGNHKCASPNPAGLALALAAVSHTQMEFKPSTRTLAALTALAALASFLICAFIIWSERWHGRFSHDAVDVGPQKFHAVAVPRIGGLAIACAIGASIAGLTASGLLEAGSVEGFAMLALAALPAFGGGIAEDLTKKVGVLARLLLTISAGVLASILVGATITRLDVPGLDNLLQYWPLFAIAFTAFAVGGVSNAINIVDGYNGLVGAYAIIALAALAWVSVQVGDQVVLLASLTMLGAMAGFLVWNWPGGRIFLGDGGAYLLGFWLAELGVLLVVRNPEVSPWFPLVVMAYPIWETLFSMYRRKILRQHSMGRPDAMHLHHLVYHRLIRRAVGSKAPSDQNRRNNAVTLYLIPPIALLMLPALLVWDRTDALLACAGLFGVAYVWIYRRIAHRRVPQWIIRT